MRRWLSAWVLMAGLTMGAAWLPCAAVAQEPTAQEAPAGAADAESDRAQSFRAMTGPATEDVPGGALLIGAYAIVWLMVLLLVLRIGSVSRKVDADLRRLEQNFAEGEEA